MIRSSCLIVVRQANNLRSIRGRHHFSTQATTLRAATALDTTSRTTQTLSQPAIAAEVSLSDAGGHQRREFSSNNAQPVESRTSKDGVVGFPIDFDVAAKVEGNESQVRSALWLYCNYGGG